MNSNLKKLLYLTLFAIFFQAINFNYCKAGIYEIAGDNYYKKIVLVGVYVKIIKAIGINLNTAPKFLLDTSGMVNGTFYYPAETAKMEFKINREVIIFDSRLYDLCTTMKADSLNAIAFILGHELMHHYLKHHDKLKKFINTLYSSNKATKDMGLIRVDDYNNLKEGFFALSSSQNKKLAENVNLFFETIEWEADYNGCLYAYMAGYNSFNSADSILRKIYSFEQYGLMEYKGKLQHYLPLYDRTETSQRAAKDLKELLPVFDAGVNLLVLRRFNESAECFKYILKKFPSYEIYNNYGVALTLDTLSSFQRAGFVYPLDLSVETALKEVLVTKGAKKVSRLEQAEAAFKESIKLNPDYATAYINLACVYDLQSKYDMAIELIGKALKIAESLNEPELISKAYITKGIALAHKKNISESEVSFGIALKNTENEIAAYNLNYLKSISSKNKKEGSFADLSSADIGNDVEYERIHDITIAQAKNSALRVYNSFEEYELDSWKLGIYYKEDPEKICYIYKISGNNNNNEELTFMNTKEKDKTVNSNNGIYLNDTAEKVKKKYGGAPSYIISARNLEFWVYKSKNIIFIIDENNRVTGWQVYSIEN